MTLICVRHPLASSRAKPDLHFTLTLISILYIQNNLGCKRSCLPQKAMERLPKQVRVSSFDFQLDERFLGRRVLRRPREAPYPVSLKHFMSSPKLLLTLVFLLTFNFLLSQKQPDTGRLPCAVSLSHIPFDKPVPNQNRN